MRIQVGVAPGCLMVQVSWACASHLLPMKCGWAIAHTTRPIPCARTACARSRGPSDGLHPRALSMLTVVTTNQRNILITSIHLTNQLPSPTPLPTITEVPTWFSSVQPTFLNDFQEVRHHHMSQGCHGGGWWSSTRSHISFQRFATPILLVVSPPPRWQGRSKSVELIARVLRYGLPCNACQPPAAPSQ